MPAMQEAWVLPLSQEDLLEKGMATHSSIPAWKIPWTEELAGYSPRSHRVVRDGAANTVTVCSLGLLPRLGGLCSSMGSSHLVCRLLSWNMIKILNLSPVKCLLVFLTGSIWVAQA